MNKYPVGSELPSVDSREPWGDRTSAYRRDVRGAGRLEPTPVTVNGATWTVECTGEPVLRTPSVAESLEIPKHFLDIARAALPGIRERLDGVPLTECRVPSLPAALEIDPDTQAVGRAGIAYLRSISGN